MAHYRRDTLQNDKIWFQYRGKKQFEPFFEAKFDPNNNYFNFFYMYNFFFINIILPKRYTKPINFVIIAKAVKK